VLVRVFSIAGTHTHRVSSVTVWNVVPARRTGENEDGKFKSLEADTNDAGYKS